MTCSVCAGEGLGQDSDKDLGMDENTKETLRIIREQLDLGQEVDEDIDWEDLKHDGVDLDYLLDKLYVYTASLKEKEDLKILNEKVYYSHFATR